METHCGLSRSESLTRIPVWYVASRRGIAFLMPKHAPRGPIKVHDDPTHVDQPMRVAGLRGQPQRCHATTRQGTQCSSPAIRGATVCRMHGGSAPQVKFAALERLKALQPKAITVLESLLDRQEFPTVQMAAVRDVMDRTEGKAAETQTLTHAGGFTIRHILGDDDD